MVRVEATQVAGAGGQDDRARVNCIGTSDPIAVVEVERFVVVADPVNTERNIPETILFRGLDTYWLLKLY